MIEKLITHIRDTYQTQDFIPLHAPQFAQADRDYLMDAIDSTFVSSVGAYVDQFEAQLKQITEAPAVVATMNGTAGLHAVLHLAGVGAGDYVITQPLSFIATCNAIAYTGASPIFVDIDRGRYSMCPEALGAWLADNAELDGDGQCRNKADGRPIKACVPVHILGHPARMSDIASVCADWNLTLIEDAAEALGTYDQGRHAGLTGRYGVLSFNGNKIVTTGGGGAILCGEEDGKRAKHITTTAKQPHPYEFIHDELGFNYRMPNLNAALGCAQLERLDTYLESKRAMAAGYRALFAGSDYAFCDEPSENGSRSNFWLCAVACPSQEQKQALIERTNSAGVMTRPFWQLMTQTPMYGAAPSGPTPNAQWAHDHVVMLPSSPAALSS